ncbi:hypothetical protein ACVWXQ_001387 [Bradyrhizobium sp. S3.14.4]
MPMHLSDDWNLISVIALVSQPSRLFNSNCQWRWGHHAVIVLLAYQPGQTHPGRWFGLHHSVRQRSDPGDRQVPVRSDGCLLSYAGTLGDRCFAQNQWSIGGNPLRPPVNAFLAQPFLNYNMAHGWYLTTAPIITSNWLAASGEPWTVRIGGGFGRVFRVCDQPVNASIAGITMRYTRPALRPGNYKRPSAPIPG